MPLAGLLVGLKPCLWSKTTSTKNVYPWGHRTQWHEENQGERCGTLW